MLTVAIAIAVLITAIGMLFQRPLHAIGRKFRTTDSDSFKAAQAPLTVAAGAVLGIMVTLTSIGAGALGAVFFSVSVSIAPYAA